MTDLTPYGFQPHHDLLAREYGETAIPARILSQEKDLYRIISRNGEGFAEVSGRFRYRAGTVSDFPAVGDFVAVCADAPQDNAVIQAVLPRKTVFIRKAAGTGTGEQVVAANIDTLFLCMSLNKDFNLRRLERYLAIAWDSGAAPVIVLTKSDLCPDIPARLWEIRTVAFGTEVVTTSALDGDASQKLLPYLGPGKTAALIGSSGTGKSTLINQLLGENRLETQGLRSDDKGRHTTTRRQLFLLPGGGMVIDTPGMRELGLWSVDQGLDQSFSDIEALAAHCRFRNCTHTTEPHCAVRAAMEIGELSPDRLRSYEKLKTENRYSQDAEVYLEEKKQKFKNIAKINRSRKR